ncbi:MAG: cupin domain-containing protein [Lachnospiraceae bacterium]|nr:cupin domain-containing protein [Lachnospiraceae bacterium]
MIIDFNNMKESVLPNFKGGEKEYAVKMKEDELNRIMRGRLIPGASIGLHSHETDSEIIFVSEGKGKVLYDDGEERVEAGMCHYCPKGHTHSLMNDSDSDLVFFAVVAKQ